MNMFVVIGLGRFGSSVAAELSELGHQVLAIDTDEAMVQRMADQVTQAVVADCRDQEVLRELGVKNADCGVVAFSNDIGNSALITLNLKELGIPRIICKARDHSHEELLLRSGADEVVFPERQSGRWLARTLDNRHILSYVELSERYGIVKIKVPVGWEDKTLRELDIRSKYQVNIVAIQSADGTLQTVPDPGYRFRKGDLVFTLGRNESNERLIMG